VDKLNYKISSCSEVEIFGHLEACDTSFYPALSSRVDLRNYSKKIKDSAITFESYDSTLLVGLVAVYVDESSKRGFLTSVSIIPTFRGRGIAKKLLHQMLSYLSKLSFVSVELEVHHLAKDARNLYHGLGFVNFNQSRDETMKMIFNFNYHLTSKGEVDESKF